MEIILYLNVIIIMYFESRITTREISRRLY